MANMKEVYAFLKELKEHNDRDWFNSRKNDYLELRSLWESDIEKLISLMSEYDEPMRRLPVKECTYRIYRDMRFSLDKSPYKVFFSAVLGAGGRKTKHATCYLHMQPSESALYGGIWCPEAPVLNDLRHEVVDNIEEFMSIIKSEEFANKFEFCGEKLKKVPRGFVLDDDVAEYAKMKEYMGKYQVPDTYFFDDNWPEKAAEDFRRVKKFNDFLNFIFE